jgi:outer membrane protein OmpA-like peptidoglycan-associated protein
LVNVVMTLLVLAIALGTTPVSAQFGSIMDAAKRAQEELQKKKKAEEQAQKEAAAKKEAEAKKEQPAAAPASAPAQPSTAPAAAQQAAADGAPSFQAYSKFDFVPGEKIVVVDDFTQDAIGDFPAKWNTNASGEVVTIAGKPGRWLKLAGSGFFSPELINALPDNFTFEFDLLSPPTFKSGFSFAAVIAELPRPGLAGWQGANNAFTLRLHPGSGAVGSTGTELRQNAVSAPASSKSTTKFTKTANPVHISLWRQRERVRVYLNEEKAWDLAKALVPAAKFNRLFFAFRNDEVDSEYYVANLRLAVGAPDTRNKLLTEGKWVTHGILFDVNSDRVKPESYGALKEIVNVLTENAEVKIQIVGHTDADGDDARNLDLSKRRAVSVRAVLAKEFGIAEDRMDTDGKGKRQPVDKNDTPTGKANNRRVEFIKK